ncbi:biotin transporter BioY [Cnuibacter sp. UC19_7]|uniref:biotin transporter BioY n=1 Tax=Cnuibacter sp. UC19_7 TaxID=3350166 RepID=UPI003670B381
MSTVSLAYGRPTIADRLIPRSLVTDIVLVAAGAGLTGLLAQWMIPVGPVPFSGQTLAVLLVGASLGAARGAISLALYALLGVVGVPWFTDGAHGLSVLIGGTGGYILGFIAAAALVGWLAQREWDRKIVGAIVAFLAGSVTIYAIALPWLAVVGGYDLATTLTYGLYPFILGDVMKALVAGAALPLSWKLVARLKR